MHYIYENFWEGNVLDCQNLSVQKTNKKNSGSKNMQYLHTKYYFFFFLFGEKCIFVRYSQPLLKKHHHMDFTSKVCVPHVTTCFCTCESRSFLQENVFFFHCFLTWLECVFGIDHKCLRQSSRFICSVWASLSSGTGSALGWSLTRPRGKKRAVWTYAGKKDAPSISSGAVAAVLSAVGSSAADWW